MNACTKCVGTNLCETSAGMYKGRICVWNGARKDLEGLTCGFYVGQSIAETKTFKNLMALQRGMQTLNALNVRLLSRNDLFPGCQVCHKLITQ